MTLTIRILGLDPGLSAMGWGVIEVSGSRLGHVAHGVIATKPAIGLGVRLMALHRALVGGHSKPRAPPPSRWSRPLSPAIPRPR